MQDAIKFLNELPLAGLMLVVAAGYSIGRLSFKGMSPGPAGGTLIAALLLGWLGLDLMLLYGSTEPEVTVGKFGFCLFIYSVGFEAGPGVTACLRGGKGLKFAGVGAMVCLFATTLAILAGLVLSLDASTTAGVLAGALTSAPTYAAASEEAADAARLSVAFALTYPFGLAGLVLMIQIMPRLMGSDLAADTSADDRTGVDIPTRIVTRALTPELTRAFEVTKDDITGKPLHQLDLTHRTGCYITRLHREDDVLLVSANTVLERGDHLLVTGRLDELQVFEEIVGPEIYDKELRERLPTPRKIYVTARSVDGKSLQEIDILRRHQCLITRIERAGEAIEPMASVELHRGDVVEVVGRRDAVRLVAAELGRFETSTQTTDIAIYAGGVFFGLLLGSVALHPFGINLSLGFAGGLLLAGLLLGRLRKLGRFSAHVPRPARQLVRDLGILLFVAETGVRAGRALTEGLGVEVWSIVGAGMVVTVVPVVLAIIFGRFVLKLRPADAWGSVCGGMTSSAALAAVKRASDSNEPAVSYAAAFALASVLVTVSGQVVVRLME